MGWESRSYGRNADGGNFRRVLRRIFGDGENPFSWSLPLYTAWGIRVRVHLIFVIMVIAELIGSMSRNGIGPAYMASAMAGLFVLVLLHEYGHCIACRRVGGTADQILMWPLGGLAYCQPPYHWKADLITTLGGPAVNVILAPVLAGVLLGLGQGLDAIVFNPFDPGGAMLNLQMPDGTLPYWLAAVWWVYYSNLVLLLFNMLVPMYPMDCGRVLFAVLWPRMGDRAAMRVTTTIGLGAAMVLFVIGMVGSSGTLVGVAIFGGITCYIERKRLAMTEGDVVLPGYDFSRGYTGMPPEEEGPSKAEIRRREKERKQAEDDQAELDRILAKIAATGMASLSGSEKKWLQRQTARKRAET